MSAAQPVARAPVLADARGTGIRVRQAVGRDLGAVMELRLALLREHPDHPIYGRLRSDVSARAHELFSAQLRSATESIFLAERDGDVVGILRCVESMGSRANALSTKMMDPTTKTSGIQG